MSVDGRATWQAVARQRQRTSRGGRVASYWTPVPAGVDAVRFRGRGADPWLVRDVSIWAREAR